MIRFLILFLSLGACGDSSKEEMDYISDLSGNYYGAVDKINLEFNFKKHQNKFRLISGIIGEEIKREGSYSLNGDTIELRFNKVDSIIDQNIKHFFIIDGDSCLINIDSRINFCQRNSSSKSRNELLELEEERIVEMVSNLKEVEDAISYIVNNSVNNRELKIWVESKPWQNIQGVYVIKVIEDNGVAIHNWMSFEVNPTNHNIMYFDVIEGELLSLEAWRRKVK